jgi:hypothetical protein
MSAFGGKADIPPLKELRFRGRLPKTLDCGDPEQMGRNSLEQTGRNSDGLESFLFRRQFDEPFDDHFCREE